MMRRPMRFTAPMGTAVIHHSRRAITQTQTTQRRYAAAFGPAPLVAKPLDA